MSESTSENLLKSLNIFLRSNHEITTSNKENIENFLDYDELWPARIISQILSIWFLTIPALVTVGRHPVSIVNYADRQIRHRLLMLPHVLANLLAKRKNIDPGRMNEDDWNEFNRILRLLWEGGVGRMSDDVFLRVR